MYSPLAVIIINIFLYLLHLFLLLRNKRLQIKLLKDKVCLVSRLLLVPPPRSEATTIMDLSIFFFLFLIFFFLVSLVELLPSSFQYCFHYETEYRLSLSCYKGQEFVQGKYLEIEGAFKILFLIDAVRGYTPK